MDRIVPRQNRSDSQEEHKPGRKFFEDFSKSWIHWVVVSNIFHFHPYLGKIPILTNIFQRG